MKKKMQVTKVTMYLWETIYYIIKLIQSGDIWFFAMISYVIIGTTNSISATRKTLKLINRSLIVHKAITNHYCTFILVLFPIFK